MISFDEALSIVRRVAHPLGTEIVPLAAAYGRTLAAAVVARIDSPRAAVSAMDGYAVREADLAGGTFRVVGTAFAGAGFPGRVGSGDCVRIFTGASLPEGADRVVVQEIVRRVDDRAVVEGHIGAARHVRPRASDFRTGDVLLRAGTRLGPRPLVATAGADTAAVEVWRRPGVAVLGTGDELAEPGTARQHAERIPESLSFGVAALAQDWGGNIGMRARVEDDPAAMQAAASEALDRSDLLVVIGGASVGEKDLGKPALQALGLEVLFSKVAIKPGKPVWLGKARGKLVLGLPGNPTSAMVTARLLLAPLLLGLGGRNPEEGSRWTNRLLAGRIHATGERETFLRARYDGDGVCPVSSQDGSAQRALAEADLLIRRPAESSAAEPGEAVEVLDF